MNITPLLFNSVCFIQTVVKLCSVCVCVCMQIPEALGYVRQALQLQGDDVHSLHLLALLLSAQKHYHDALNIIEMALSEYPENFKWVSHIHSIFRQTHIYIFLMNWQTSEFTVCVCCEVCCILRWSWKRCVEDQRKLCSLVNTCCRSGRVFTTLQTPGTQTMTQFP